VGRAPRSSPGPGGAWGHPPRARTRAAVGTRARMHATEGTRAPVRYLRRRSPRAPGAPGGSPREPKTSHGLKCGENARSVRRGAFPPPPRGAPCPRPAPPPLRAPPVGAPAVRYRAAGCRPGAGAGAACRRVPAGKFFDFFFAKCLTWHEAVCSMFLSIPKGATKGNLQHV